MKGRGALLITGTLFALHPHTCVDAAAPTDFLHRLSPDVVEILQEHGHGQTGWIDGLARVDRSTRATMAMNRSEPSVERVLQLIQDGDWETGWDAVPLAAQTDPRVVEAAIESRYRLNDVLSGSDVARGPIIAAAFRTWDSLPASIRGDSESVKSILMAHPDKGPLKGLRDSLLEHLAEVEGGNEEEDADHAGGTETASRIWNKWASLVAAPAVKDTDVLSSAITSGALRTWSALPLTAKTHKSCVLAAIEADLITPDMIAAAGVWPQWVETINVAIEAATVGDRLGRGFEAVRRWGVTVGDPEVVTAALRKGLIRRWTDVPLALRSKDPPNRELFEAGVRRILVERASSSNSSSSSGSSSLDSDSGSAPVGPLLFGDIGEIRWMLAGQVVIGRDVTRVRTFNVFRSAPASATGCSSRGVAGHGSSRPPCHSPPALMAVGVLTSARRFLDSGGSLSVELREEPVDEASHRALICAHLGGVPCESLQVSQIHDEDDEELVNLDHNSYLNWLYS